MRSPTGLGRHRRTVLVKVPTPEGRFGRWCTGWLVHDRMALNPPRPHSAVSSAAPHWPTPHQWGTRSPAGKSSSTLRPALPRCELFFLDSEWCRSPRGAQSLGRSVSPSATSSSSSEISTRHGATPDDSVAEFFREERRIRGRWPLGGVRLDRKGQSGDSGSGLSWYPGGDGGGGGVPKPPRPIDWGSLSRGPRIRRCCPHRPRRRAIEATRIPTMMTI